MGKKGYSPSEATRAKLSAAHKGRIKSDETRARLSASKIGHPVSEETREKLRKATLQQHAKAREHGKRLGLNKLTEQEVTEIKNLYAQGGMTQKAIGTLYGVSQTQVGNILRGDQWK